MMNKSPHLARKLSENDRLVQLLNDCTKNGNCFVDNNKVFRKAYCGSINEIGTLITKLPMDKREQFCDNQIWQEFFSGYLKPIIDIERPDRDDVFRKSNKFDRSGPDYGQNIPFELISALNSLQLSKDHLDRLNNKSDNDNDNDNNDELTENDGILGDQKDDEAVESIETTETLDVSEPVITTSTTDAAESLQKQAGNSDDKEEHPTKPLWDEFTTQLRHQKSLGDQVIETKQDHDLEKEMEQNLKNKEHQPELTQEALEATKATQDNGESKKEQKVEDKPETKE